MGLLERLDRWMFGENRDRPEPEPKPEKYPFRRFCVSKDAILYNMTQDEYAANVADGWRSHAFEWNEKIRKGRAKRLGIPEVVAGPFAKQQEGTHRCPVCGLWYRTAGDAPFPPEEEGTATPVLLESRGDPSHCQFCNGKWHRREPEPAPEDADDN